MAETFTLVEAAKKVLLDRRSIRDYTPEPVADRRPGFDFGDGAASAVR